MEVLKGNGTSHSYFSASLFNREVSEFGAFPHSMDWKTHEVIDKQPPGADFWEWSGTKPEDYQPRVVESELEIFVEFYTFSEWGTDAIHYHYDRYEPGSYIPTSTTDRIIARGVGGTLI